MKEKVSLTGFLNDTCIKPSRPPKSRAEPRFPGVHWGIERGREANENSLVNISPLLQKVAQRSKSLCKFQCGICIEIAATTTET